MLSSFPCTNNLHIILINRSLLSQKLCKTKTNKVEQHLLLPPFEVQLLALLWLFSHSIWHCHWYLNQSDKAAFCFHIHQSTYMLNSNINGIINSTIAVTIIVIVLNISGIHLHLIKFNLVGMFNPNIIPLIPHHYN